MVFIQTAEQSINVSLAVIYYVTDLEQSHGKRLLTRNLDYQLLTQVWKRVELTVVLGYDPPWSSRGGVIFGQLFAPHLS